MFQTSFRTEGAGTEGTDGAKNVAKEVKRKGSVSKKRKKSKGNTEEMRMQRKALKVILETCSSVICPVISLQRKTIFVILDLGLSWRLS